MDRNAKPGHFGRFILFIGATLASVVLLNPGTPALGAVISYNYTATDGTATVTGTFGWEDTIVDAHGDPSFGWYQGAGFLTGTVAQGLYDGTSFSFGGEDVLIDNDAPFDQLQMWLNHSTESYLGFHDGGGAALPSDALPTTFDLNAWADQAQLIIDYGEDIPEWDGQDGRPIGGMGYYNITDVSAAVPEPATIALLGIGLAGLAGAEVRRRRKKKAVDNS